jgi:hypothetical protein
MIEDGGGRRFINLTPNSTDTTGIFSRQSMRAMDMEKYDISYTFHHREERSDNETRC